MIIEFFEEVGISHHFFDYLLKNGRFILDLSFDLLWNLQRPGSPVSDLW